MGTLVTDWRDPVIECVSKLDVKFYLQISVDMLRPTHRTTALSQRSGVFPLSLGPFSGMTFDRYVQ